MIAVTTLLYEFMPLPRINLGKIWRRLVKEPVRPLAQPLRPEKNEAIIVAAIMEPGARVPEGFVFKLPDGRLFYAPIIESSSEIQFDGIEQLHHADPDITKGSDASGPHSNPQPYSKLGLGIEKSPVNDPAVTRLLVKAYYGTKAPQKLAELSL